MSVQQAASAVKIPEIVLKELDRRARKGASDGTAVDPAVIHALRGWFLYHDGSPEDHGGYLDICEALGVTPSSTDIVAKRIEFNVTPPSDRGLDKRQLMTLLDREREAHQGRVRLLRYGEFLKRKEEKVSIFCVHSICTRIVSGSHERTHDTG